MLPFIVIFVSLHTEEHATQNQGQNQENNQKLTLSDGGKMHRESHGQAAADQNGGIGRANPETGLQARRRERSRVCLPVNEIGQKQSTEKHNFGEQEAPHPDGRSIALLLGFSK